MTSCALPVVGPSLAAPSAVLRVLLPRVIAALPRGLRGLRVRAAAVGGKGGGGGFGGGGGGGLAGPPGGGGGGGGRGREGGLYGAPAELLGFVPEGVVVGVLVVELGVREVEALQLRPGHLHLALGPLPSDHQLKEVRQHPEGVAEAVKTSDGGAGRVSLFLFFYLSLAARTKLLFSLSRAPSKSLKNFARFATLNFTLRGLSHS